MSRYRNIDDEELEGNKEINQLDNKELEEFIKFDGEVPEQYEEEMETLDGFEDDEDSVDFRLEGEEPNEEIPNLELQDALKRNNQLLEELLKNVKELVLVVCRKTV
jgi:hypothetical protein